MNRNIKILLPVIIAFAVAGGFLLGTKLQKQNTRESIRKMNIFQPDKLTLMLNLIEKDYVDTVNKKQLVESAIPSVLEELDPHTSYIPAKQMKSVNEEMMGNFSGIGVQFVMQRDTVMVVEVISGGPSERVGILAGDRIVQVNDSTIAGVEVGNNTVVSLLRGEKGTHVEVGIVRPGVPGVIKFDIERGEIPIYSVDVAYMIQPQTGIIKINRFADTTYDEFMQSMEKLKEKGVEKVIIDLRGNTGGFLNEVFRMADQFLDKGKMIVYTQGKARERKEYRASEQGVWKEGEVVILIDEYSASASEILAGAIQDNDRGLVVGRRSFGKGLVQEQIPFLDGSALRLTVARFYTPSGRCIQKSYEEGRDEYRMDIHKRIVNNELSQRDSIHLADSLKYYTDNGRIVYGGGGIMPDYFVPADTVGYNNFFARVVGQVYSFAFNFADQHRHELDALNETDEIIAYLKSNNIYEKFIDHIKAKGIEYNKAEADEAHDLLEWQLYAYIARNNKGNEGFYPVYYKNDKTVQQALKLLNDDVSVKEVAALQ